MLDYFQSLVGLRLLLASGVSYELGVNGEKRLMEAGILLIKINIAHFTLVNLGIFTI